MKAGILGAGHAGIKAAELLCEAGAEVRVYSNEPDLPYFRPRTIALAFGQAERDEVTMHPEAWYAERHIDIRLNERVESFDPASLKVTSATGTETFDALIVATGAGPFMPPITPAPLRQVRPLWTQADALAIREDIQPGHRLAIIGGGILGLETALRATARGVRVTVLERLPRLLPVQFGNHAADLLARDLTRRGIVVHSGCFVKTIEPKGNALLIHLEKGEAIEADHVIVSVGARRNTPLCEAAGLSVEQGILVDAFLRASHANVWAAGDIIQLPGITRCSALDATMQGRVAAFNAMAVTTGEPWKTYQPADASTNFKFQDFEIHAIGRVTGPGDTEEVVDGDETRCRIRVLDADKRLVGAQMIGTGQDFKRWCSELPV